MNMNTPVTREVTIASSGTVSTALDLAERVPTHIVTPAALTGTAITFQACDTIDGTYNPLYKDDGNALSITVSTSRVTALGAYFRYFFGLRYIKLVSGSAEGAARTIQVYMRPSD